MLLGAGVLPSLLSSLLWAVHPVSVEVFAWPSATPYALAGLFSLLAAVAVVLRGRWHRAAHWLSATACIMYVCAVFSKSAAIALPGALVLLDQACLRSPSSKQFHPHPLSLYVRRERSASTD
jgi:hypothetical protein